MFFGLSSSFSGPSGRRFFTLPARCARALTTACRGLVSPRRKARGDSGPAEKRLVPVRTAAADRRKPILLKNLMNRGISGYKKAAIVSRLAYALESWGPFLQLNFGEAPHGGTSPCRYYYILDSTENEKQTHPLLLKTARLFPPADGVFLVGGCVRDLLAGELPADYDLAVSGQPAAYARQLAHRHGGRPVAIGPARHRIFRVVAGNRVFDVSPLVGNSIFADLKNRDFTINAMAFDLDGQVLVDPENGRADLQNRVIRMVSPNAFSNDPLRQLRAFRLAAQFQCRIEPQTLQAIRTSANIIKSCAGERIRVELLKMLMFPESSGTLRQMADCGLLFEIIPELAELAQCRQNDHHSFDVWNHTLAACRHLEALIGPGDLAGRGTLINRAAVRLQSRNRTGLLKLALLLHDIGKPATRSQDAQGQVHFHGHGHRGVEIATGLCHRLKFSRRETEYLNGVIKNHNRPLFLFLLHGENRLSTRAITRFFIQCAAATPEILLHALADFAGKRAAPGADLANFTGFIETLLERYFTAYARRLAGPRLLTGRDLMDTCGLPPSPLFKKILARVETARLAGEISDKQQALDLVRRMLDPPELPPPSEHS